MEDNKRNEIKREIDEECTKVKTKNPYKAFYGILFCTVAVGFMTILNTVYNKGYNKGFHNGYKYRENQDLWDADNEYDG